MTIKRMIEMRESENTYDESKPFQVEIRKGMDTIYKSFSDPEDYLACCEEYDAQNCKCEEMMHKGKTISVYTF